MPKILSIFMLRTTWVAHFSWISYVSSDILQMPIEKCYSLLWSKVTADYVSCNTFILDYCWLLQPCVFFRAAKCLHWASQKTLNETSFHTPSYTHINPDIHRVESYVVLWAACGVLLGPERLMGWPIHYQQTFGLQPCLSSLFLLFL